MTPFEKCINRYNTMNACYEVKEFNNGNKLVTLLTEKDIFNFLFDVFGNPIYGAE